MRPVDADELVMFPYSERSGTEDQIAEWIEQAGLSGDDTADRARELCWRVIEGCVNVVKTQPTLTPQNEWVSVDERLPTDERPVLVFVGYADTMTGFITTSSYFCFDANPHWQWDGLVRDEQRTLFWMPLPAPPGKDNNVPTKEQNEPLTIEQLREMDGEPVWVDFTGSVIKREPGWFILKNAQDEEVYLVGKTSVYKGYEYYGKTWLAYRCPPERQEKI